MVIDLRFLVGRFELHDDGVELPCRRAAARVLLRRGLRKPLSVTAQVNELAAAFEMGRRWSRITPDELRSKKVTNPNVADEVFKTVLTPPP